MCALSRWERVALSYLARHTGHSARRPFLIQVNHDEIEVLYIVVAIRDNEQCLGRCHRCQWPSRCLHI